MDVVMKANMIMHLSGESWDVSDGSGKTLLSASVSLHIT